MTTSSVKNRSDVKRSRSPMKGSFTVGLSPSKYKLKKIGERSSTKQRKFLPSSKRIGLLNSKTLMKNQAGSIVLWKNGFNGFIKPLNRGQNTPNLFFHGSELNLQGDGSMIRQGNYVVYDVTLHGARERTVAVNVRRFPISS